MNIPEDEAGGRLTIDLGAFAANWKKLAAMAAPADCAGVIKANAYGIGIEQAAPALWTAGLPHLFRRGPVRGKARPRTVLARCDDLCAERIAAGNSTGLCRTQAAASARLDARDRGMASVRRPIG